MDGVLVVDKPEGLTSHDVVALARRALGERRIGHTGTLDPLATGVLPLACGRATRLVRFLTASDKDYEATIRFGLTTDSYDVSGEETGRTELRPDRDAVLRGIASLSGAYLQTPPAFSAKKVGGTPAYKLARAGRGRARTGSTSDRPAGPAVELRAVPVTVSRADLVAFDGTTARVALTCSAGFYVRSFAHELGQRIGTGACLEALRRTRSGEFTLDSAVGLDVLQAGGSAGRILPLEALLPAFPALRLTAEELDDVSHGREIQVDVKAPWVRLLAPDGGLVALGRPGSGPGSLHPAIVLT